MSCTAQAADAVLPYLSIDDTLLQHYCTGSDMAPLSHSKPLFQGACT